MVGCLMAFVGLRNSFFVGVAIPLSMMASFLVLGWIGYTLNMMVLFSLILMLGMLVDNAVVIVENIYRHREHGDAGPDAAYEATVEVARPVIASTITTLCAFSPLLIWPGIIGDFMSLPAGDAHHRSFGVAGGGADHQSDAVRPSDETAAARCPEGQHGRTPVPPRIPASPRVVAPSGLRRRDPFLVSSGTGRSPRVSCCSWESAWRSRSAGCSSRPAPCSRRWRCSPAWACSRSCSRESSGSFGA